MKVIQADLWLCVECMIGAVNDDFTSIDSDERVKAVREGLSRLGPHLVPDFDCETSAGMHTFSRCGCDACETHLAGERYRFAVLGIAS